MADSNVTGREVELPLDIAPVSYTHLFTSLCSSFRHPGVQPCMKQTRAVLIQFREIRLPWAPVSHDRRSAPDHTAKALLPRWMKPSVGFFYTKSIPMNCSIRNSLMEIEGYSINSVN